MFTIINGFHAFVVAPFFMLMAYYHNNNNIFGINLLDNNIIRQLSGKGRNVHYDLVWPKQANG